MADEFQERDDGNASMLARNRGGYLEQRKRIKAPFPNAPKDIDCPRGLSDDGTGIQFGRRSFSLGPLWRVGIPPLQLSSLLYWTPAVGLFRVSYLVPWS